MNKHKKIKNGKQRAIEFALFNHGLYRPKIIPNKKKAQQLKRKKVDIRQYQPFYFCLTSVELLFLWHHRLCVF